MKTLLSFGIFLFICTLSTGLPPENANNICGGHPGQDFSYVVESDLPVDEFFDRLCERLINTYNWNEVSAAVVDEETFAALFTYHDDEKNTWLCKIMVEKVRNEENKVYVEIIIDPYSGS